MVLQHQGRNIGNPKAKAPRRTAPALECVACGLRVYLSWKDYGERDSEEPVFCFSCSEGPEKHYAF